MSNNTIPYGKHFIDDDDVAAVVDVLKNRFLTQGNMIPEFEQRLADYTGSKYCTSVNSGTSGLHIACLAAGVGQGDFVWTVPNSFVASANCGLYCGARIDFVDIDPNTRNISLTALSDKLRQAELTGSLPKVLIVVHFSGLSCDMQAIHKLTKKYNICIIEDAAHALGGHYQDSRVGSCRYSDMTVLSFHPVKSITTAEGGAVTCNDARLQQRLSLFAKHGVTRDPLLMEGESDGDWYYQQIELGYNYRLSDLHAALGISQLSKLDTFVQQRKQKARVYQNELAELPLRLPSEMGFTQSAWHLYMIEVITHDRKTIFDALRAKGVGVNVHYIPIHLQPYYRSLGFSHGDFPNSEAFYQKAITIPLFPTMSADDQSKVIQALKEVLS